MDKREEITVLLDGLDRHSAVLAWRKIEAGSAAPRSIEVLKPERRKTTVYRLNGVGPEGRAVVVKRKEQGELEYERRLYREVFPAFPGLTLRFYGFVDSYRGDSWLFLEDAGELWYSADEPEHRELAIEWIAGLHTAFRELPWLPRRGAPYYRESLEGAREGVYASLRHPALVPANLETLTSIIASLDVIEQHWANVEDACSDVPETLVHGDFVPKNVRVCSRLDRRYLVAFDWETAGWGPPATDLAQLPDGEPALGDYHARVRSRWPTLRRSDLKRLRRIGELFRLINCVRWESRTFKHDWIAQGIENMEVYETWLRSAAGDLARTVHGNASVARASK